MSLKTTNCKLQQNEIGCTLADKGASTTSLRLLPRTSPPDSVEFLIECRFDRDPLSTKELYSTILDRAGLIRLQQAISAALALAMERYACVTGKTTLALNFSPDASAEKRAERRRTNSQMPAMGDRSCRWLFH